MDDLVSPMRVVSVTDPALDMTAEQLKRYATSRDLSQIVLKPGHKPRVFHIRALTLTEEMTVDTQGSLVACDTVAFRFGVTRIENLRGDGVTMEPSAKGLSELDEPTTSWSQKELAVVHRAFGGRSPIYEIGLLIRHRADFAGKGASGLAPWPLSPLAWAVAEPGAKKAPQSSPAAETPPVPAT